VFTSFRAVTDPDRYRPLPDDWTLGLADIVDSTGAIAANRYKAVNMAGAAIIAATANALGGRDFPFVFGGDGASFAVAPRDRDRARDALAATAAWVRDELRLIMRIAMVPITAVRANGQDVRVARYAPSPHLTYAMFSGGGVNWSEAAMKRSEFAIAPDLPGAQPDLDGLSCRFAEIPSAHGQILSLLVVPAAMTDLSAFGRLIEEMIALIEQSPNAGRPIPDAGPPLHWPSFGLDYEARAIRGGPLLMRRIRTLGRSLFVYLLIRLRIPLGGFVPDRYLAELIANSDFRKSDDGLRMVLDCTPALAREIEQRLAAAASSGIARYGLHAQDAAMMTCFTPSAMRSDHVHFIDGARGGYAAAALALKMAR
jgi:hypothetical protein